MPGAQDRSQPPHGGGGGGGGGVDGWWRAAAAELERQQQQHGRQLGEAANSPLSLFSQQQSQANTSAWLAEGRAAMADLLRPAPAPMAPIEPLPTRQPDPFLGAAAARLSAQQKPPYRPLPQPPQQLYSRHQQPPLSVHPRHLQQQEQQLAAANPLLYSYLTGQATGGGRNPTGATQQRYGPL